MKKLKELSREEQGKLFCDWLEGAKIERYAAGDWEYIPLPNWAPDGIYRLAPTKS